MPEISNRAREALYPSVREMFELASHVPDAISFAIGEPGFDTPRPMIDAAYRAALAGDTHYTPNRGRRRCVVHGAMPANEPTARVAQGMCDCPMWGHERIRPKDCAACMHGSRSLPSPAGDQA
ncbi:hypothetical protein [Bifidobacterium vespertilionis]|uniref:hypothetical protein n=1 Tax=Bifidobacterium vespertilionis TaxID=2562524 RepID=UPI001BDC62F6|nr:hypothetical protein [Bifidobacterium vespertilionis]MBT1178179.1 hypothetical protein [Bifidobacterium vespertilionis]